MPISPQFQHALEVLEYDRMREVISSYAASALGRRLASKMMPLADVPKLRELLSETSELRELMQVRRLPLQGLSDITTELRDLVKFGRPAEPDLLYRVVDMLRIAQTLRATLSSDPGAYPHLARLAEGLEDIPELREGIPEAIDSKDGVRDEASEKLLGYRDQVRSLRNELRDRVGALRRSSKLAKCLQAEGIAMKDDRYLLPVKVEYRSWVRGPIRDRSNKGATLYVEPEAHVTLGDRLLDVLDDERREVTRILWEFTRRVLDRRKSIEKLQSRLARIDFAFAKASYASAFQLEVPELDESGALELLDARHPYLLWHERDARRDLRDIDVEALHARVVPLTVRLGDGVQMLIITGPNTGGKTVVLKTIGLNCLLALSGVPIAARSGSRVPLFSDVFADIGDEQSLEQSLSTFSSHLTQIRDVLNHASDRSLILLDELGSGTDPIEGAALGKAILDQFRSMSWTAVITTHLGSLKQYAYLNDGVENAAMEFDQASLSPTYRLLLGVPGHSNALAVAQRLGISGEIIQAARGEIDEVEEPTRELISKMEQSRRRIEKERRRTEKARRRVQGEARAYEERLQEVEARKESLDREADAEMDRVMREARDEMSAILLQLKNVPQSHRPLVEELEQKVDRLLRTTPLGEKREAFARSLKKECEVYVPKFRCQGIVKKINKGERRLTVLMDGIPTQLSFDDISWLP